MAIGPFKPGALYDPGIVQRPKPSGTLAKEVTGIVGANVPKPSGTLMKPIEKPSFGNALAKPMTPMTPINKATDMSRTPSLPFSSKF